jgi:aminoglycoside phosphotransferase (APT) family kinase protein
MTSSARASEEYLGEGSVERWLTAELGLVPPLRVERIAGGWSNVTSLVTAAEGRQVVIRQPPSGHVGGGAHDVLREARICSALGDTAVPVPQVLATCEDLEVAPQPFYVMALVPGAVIGSAEAARTIKAEDRRGLGFALIDVLVDLQAVNPDDVGLSDFHRNTPYLQRQLRRWRAQWQATSDRQVPAIERVARQLQERAAELDAGAAEVLVHQDFRFGNVMVTRDPAPRISGLLDWELTTLGHPLADLGFLGARMQAPEEVLESGVDPSAVEGYPSFAELVDRFGERTAVPTDEITTFVAMSAWRWAIIVQGIATRIEKGAMGHFTQDAHWHRHRVDLLAAFAAELLD